MYAPTLNKVGALNLKREENQMGFSELVRSEVVKPKSIFKSLHAPTLISGSLNLKGYFERCTHLLGARQ